MKYSTKELEDAVCNIIQIIKQIPELADTKLKIAGGLALRRYLDEHQPVDAIHFVVDLQVGHEFFFAKLLENPLSPFELERRVLYYHSPAGRSIPVKFGPDLYRNRIELLPIYDIAYATVPYITPQELDRLYPNPSRSSASDVRKRQSRANDEGPALKSRHKMDTKRQTSENQITKQSAVASSSKDVITEGATLERRLSKHRRTRSDPSLCSSFMMTKE
ncbi:hypothetical protein FHL15_001902 [Xylaria flabelliformis]|uniref:Uncharacterized protein n=1 Tax=Xylaria flabelliformis TaxID=2512241 RepID=A0A553IA86_9PEZI|nr:hypothetical protein FHL15_001902 [Xylaria flabelliformis]